MVLNDSGVFGFSGEIAPFIGVIFHIIEFFTAIRVVDVTPALTADPVIALIVTGDSGALARSARVIELWQETEPLEIRAGRHAGELDQSGIDVEQLRGLHAPLTTFDTGTCEDEGNFSAAIP